MKTSRQNRAAEEAGPQVANPMAVALTDSPLLVLRISKPITMGEGGDEKVLISAVTLSDIDSIETKRLLVGTTAIVTVRGVAINPEAGGARMTRPWRRTSRERRRPHDRIFATIVPTSARSASIRSARTT
jgi:hypothetical protein